MTATKTNPGKLLKIFSIILALSLALNIAFFLREFEVYPVPARREIPAESDSFADQLNQSKNELNKFQGISPTIDKVINEANLQIAEMENEIRKLRQEKSVQMERNTVLEDKNRILVRQADSIKELYINIIDSLLVERESKKLINSKIEMLEDMISRLNTRLGSAAMLTADNLKVTPIKKGTGGKNQPTAIAKQVNGIEIQFDLLENRVSRPGLKNIYIVLTSPDAKVLYDTRTGITEFYHPEYQKTAECSLSEAVNYKNQIISFSAKFQPEGALKPGLYLAEVFTTENKLLMTTFSLK